MPVSGNEEPGVLSRQSSSSSSGIVPLKKRWYSMVQPIRAERSSFSNENESKTKDSALSQGSTLTSCDSTGKSDTPRNSLLKVKEERPSGAKVDSQPTMLPFLSISPETNPNTSSDTSRNVDNLKPALAKKLAGQGAIGRTTVTVKKEAIANQGESHGKLELPANSGNVELSLGPKEPQVSSLVDPSLLSLSLNKGKDISQDGSCKIGLNNKAADDNAHTNRSNWDLNTPMDSWEAGDDASVKETSHISSASVIGANDNKGKQVVGASEQGFTFPISSIHPTLRYKSVDVLRLSLGSTLREFDSSALQSWAKVASSRVSTNSGLLKNLALDRNMNSTTCKTVKSEPVEETSVQANVGTVCRPAGTLEANVVKTEVVSQNQQSIELSTKDLQKLVEQKPMKCEPLQEVSQEISMTSDVIAHQSVGRVLQLQESSSSSCSSSSSSTLPMPLTPQQGCPSRLSTCSDLSVSGDLCAPSEYSVHSNEDNISKNALYHANADIAAKDANFDLKESNISSDNVEASVSEGMDIEDHMGYKKTQDAHNLVAGGERSANNEEKISISAGTEEECYGSDYESDGHHAFAGHVDTASGCGREDDEYEDGEVREPMMQSIAEDPLAEGMDSDKNNESSSKNAHCSEFPGVGESHCFNNDEKDYSIPVHTVSNDDFVKGCDGKAHKIDHKDGNLQSPLLDKEGTTRDNEQRPIGAIQQGPVDQPGIADAQEGCEKSVLSDGAAAGINAAGRNVGEANNENIGRADMSPTADPYLQNAERSLNSNSSKDLSNVGGKSRIINLPRASNATSPSNFRPFMGRSPSSRSGRERYSDMEEEKFHLRRNRFQDRSFGNSRGKFMRGRGRGSTRFNSSHREWDSGHDFESYRGVSDYRFRHNRTAAVEESEFERNDYDRRLDNTAFSSSRRRKPLSDALPSFRHPPARQLSPNGREGAAMMGIQMLRRAPRNISPNRCTDEDDSELVGVRHSEKFIRDFPADISDPVYSHQQSMYDGSDGRFVQGNTKFTAMQRRCFPRMRSKSPVRCHTRSLGPWSSPRRRSTEGFSGLQDSSRHRSPVMYRDDRMRSSPRTSFTEEAIAPRRRDSPSYTARRLNDMRDVDVVQEHSHPRSLSSRRSPSDRVFNRSNRRLEIIDRRERDDGDEYYDGPIHTGRCSELRSGGRTDERRKKYGERRGPRRMRIVEEEEGNFRQSGQLWHGEEFDVSRLKRRRFT
ncbi:uncharacterized protein LOC132044821 isoform X1 [Lycium ferocissimum]|uniref:uncharacterized protein LOC132044821 isoform X1 n=1 Tax=Lycium ferocissimum TaxID=112874 RepID=UPI0028152300|nr:uncharacterized protein LOC132044821 isoform X1 [Lycium ferocissimum]